VNQLAAAHEFSLIHNGDSILVSADEGASDVLIKAVQDNKSQKPTMPDIRLKRLVTDKNTHKKSYVDIRMKMNSFGKYTSV
jgi:hypothetical protein